MYYVSRGSIPPTRHTQHRAPDGSLYAEELFGVEGFTGRSSLLYHVTPPTRTHRIEAGPRIDLEAADDGLHRHRLTKTGDVEPEGRRDHRPDPAVLQPRRRVRDRAAGRGRCPRTASTATAIADEMLFVHEGTGVCRTVFGDLATAPATTWCCRSARPGGWTRTRARTSGSCTSRRRPRSSRPKRYRNDYGQLLEHSPYWQRDLHAPEFREPLDEHGDYVIDVRSSDRITAYHYRHHPFDVVGWDGYLWPFRFDIADFQPITGRVHQPPPVHQTFQARNFVVCSFVPRKFDYHPLAIPAPYNHSNINSDEVIYYVAGNFMSRRGVDIASFTLHPAGIPHGPHPGTAEASIGKEATEELAVMVDTFHPLHVTQAAMDLDDANYPYSWLPPEDAEAHARELSERGPEAFPD